MLTKKLPTAGALIIQQRRLLLAHSRNKNCFYLPGGKVEEGEDPALALVRELSEELGLTIGIADLQYHSHISAPAFGEAAGVQMEQDCYLVLPDVHPVAQAEIGDLRFFRLIDYLHEDRQAPGAVMILQQLKQENRID